jgi:hypothetical protein
MEPRFSEYLVLLKKNELRLVTHLFILIFVNFMSFLLKENKILRNV